MPDPTPIRLAPLPPIGTPTPEPSATATPMPSIGPDEVAVGETVAILRDAEPWAELVVNEVVIDRSFPDPGPGPGGDTPSRSGDVFIAVNVTLTALADGVAIDPAGFSRSVGSDRATQVFSDLAPKPDLLPVTLGRGATTEGWVLFEAPATGRVHLDYAGEGGASSEARTVIRGS